MTALCTTWVWQSGSTISEPPSCVRKQEYQSTHLLDTDTPLLQMNEQEFQRELQRYPKVRDRNWKMQGTDPEQKASAPSDPIGTAPKVLFQCLKDFKMNVAIVTMKYLSFIDLLFCTIFENYENCSFFFRLRQSVSDMSRELQFIRLRCFLPAERIIECADCKFQRRFLECTGGVSQSAL